MQNKTIFIHIGLEKTGTTSIQNFLFHNSEALRNKSIFYSTELEANQTSLCVYSGQTKYIGNLASKKKELEIKKEFPKKIKNIINEFENSDCKNLVFSNEHLSSRLKNTDDIKNLKKLFDHSNYSIKIVMYVRNQVDLLESLYFEGIKAGGTRSLSDWANSFDYFELDLTKMLEKWGSVFGKDSIIVRLFDRSILKNGDAIDDFLELLSVQSDEKFERSDNHNTSLGYKSIEFMRIYNSHVSESERKTYLLNTLLNNYSNDKQKISLSHDDRVKLFNKYDASNHEFLKNYLPEISYDFFIQTSRNPKEQKFSENILWDIINHIINQKAIIKNKQPLQQPNIHTVLNDPWYHFGQMSFKRKIWTMGKIVSKKIRLYWLLRPIAESVKKIVGK